MPATTRRVKLLQLNISPNLGLAQADAGNESAIRRYAALKGMTLPGDLDIVVEAATDGKFAFHVHVYENADTDPPGS